MKIHMPRLILVALASLSVTFTVWAQSTVQPQFSSTSLSAYPPYMAERTGGPMVMLTASRDHTLFAPIYTDYEDVDGDGSVDSTFKPTFRYYGYFDSQKCYAYVASSAPRFEPVAMAKAESDGRFRCNQGGATAQWAGNYLNWATMTRLDVVRKILYGGRRLLDSNTDTTLQMASLAHDVHAFVKYYAGADIGDHTPFTATQLKGEGLTICNRGSQEDGKGHSVMRIAKGNYSLWATTPGTVCNWSEEPGGAFPFRKKAVSFYLKYGPKGGTSESDPTAHKESVPSRSTDGGRYAGLGPELAVRVQACRAETATLKWGGENCRAYLADQKVVGKPIGLLQKFGSSDQVRQAARAEFGLISGSYDDNFRGGRLRKNVGSFNDEVDLNSGRFCHLLSSTERGASTCPAVVANDPAGGIVVSFDRLRLFDAGDYNNGGPLTPDNKRIAFPMPRRVLNGHFPSWGNPMSEMVTQALAYFAGLPMGAASKGTTNDTTVGLPVGLTQKDPLNDTLNDRAAAVPRRDLFGRSICRPMHMLALSSGSVTHDTDDEGEGEDVYKAATAFMKETIQDATNRVGELEGINGTLRSVGSVTAGFGQDCTAKPIGPVVTAGLAQVAGICPEAPAIKGSYLGAGAAFFANTRAVRPLSGLTEATGGSVNPSLLPPEALRVSSYAATLSGGVARIEVPIPGKPGKFAYITPESSWDFTGIDSTWVAGELMPGAMLTFRAIHGQKNADGSAFASYVVTWNDTQFGGDYDMDMVGFLRWEIKPIAGRPGEHELTVMTDILHHDAGASGGHGFSVMGAVSDPAKLAGRQPVRQSVRTPTQYSPDGRYLTHGGPGFRAAGTDCGALSSGSAEFRMRCMFTTRGMRQGASDSDGSDTFAWPTSYAGAAVDFFDSSAPRSTTVAKTFLVTEGAADVTLRDPLWYIAKYGSFDTGEKSFAIETSAVPQASNGSTPVNWDAARNDNQPCPSGACADGEPDGYFLARRPELLEARLDRLLGDITQVSNSAPAISTSQLQEGSLKYKAEFYQDDFGGTIEARALKKDGTFSDNPVWSATDRMTAVANRNIITDDGSKGLAFDQETLKRDENLGYRAALLGIKLSATPSDAEKATASWDKVADLVGYMRGTNVAAYRQRGKGVMGPIVNSTPWLQSHVVAARYNDVNFEGGTPSYREFVNRKATGASVLWVGANDGMLHGLNALTGDPIVSHVPSPLVGRLNAALSVRNVGAVALMDGSPFTADVLVSKAVTGFDSAPPAQREWRTYLFSSLGRGGRAVFALDTTDPANLSASAFKWVFSSTQDSDLGYQLQDTVRHLSSGQPSQVIRLNSGGFALLVPNGHGSTNGNAALFILAVNGPGANGWQAASASVTGSYRKIVLPGVAGGNNGLMGATWVDLDNNGTADVVYATDLRGQLWKFDIRSTKPSEWGSALLSTSGTASTPVPLFSTLQGTRFLPIATAPVVSFPSFGGMMISFGTGRAIEEADFPDTSTVHRFITVWDKGRYLGDVINPPQSNAPGGGNALPRIESFIRRVLRRDADGNVFQVQTDEKGDVLIKDGKEIAMIGLVGTQQFNPSANDGWYFDFPSAAEVVIGAPIRRLNFVLFTTARPAAAKPEEVCSSKPDGALYAFNPVNGLPIPSLFTESSLFMGVQSADLKLAVVGKVNAGSPVTAGGEVGTSALGDETKQDLTTSASNLRLQWREITGMRTRSSEGK